MAAWLSPTAGLLQLRAERLFTAVKRICCRGTETRSPHRTAQHRFLCHRMNGEHPFSAGDRLVRPQLRNA